MIAITCRLQRVDLLQPYFFRLDPPLAFFAEEFWAIGWRGVSLPDGSMLAFLGFFAVRHSLGRCLPAILCRTLELCASRFWAVRWSIHCQCVRECL